MTSTLTNMKRLLIAALAIPLVLSTAHAGIIVVENQLQNEAVSVTVMHSATYGTNSTNQTFQITAEPGQNASASPAFDFDGSSHTASFQVGGYNIAGNWSDTNNFSDLPFKAGPDTVVVTLGAGSWAGQPSLTKTWTNSGGASITFKSVTPPYGQASCTRVASRKSGGQCAGKGMAGYSFHTMLASLSISDTPIVYSPPIGHPVAFSVTYNQKEAYQPTNWPYFNLGPKWTMNCVSFVQDDPASPTNDVRVFPPGGGSELFTGYNSASGTYAVEPYSQSLLVKTATNSYELRFNDGSKQVFGFAAGSSPRRIFITQTVDSTGNSTSYGYETVANGVRLKTIVDAIGQTNTLAYTNASDPLKVTAFTDPFGRSANLSYGNTNGALRLVSITDPINITSSFSYGTNDFITALTTPYGTTAFGYTETNGFKMLTATDPFGQTECLQYRDKATITADNLFPSGIFVDAPERFGYRNSYYWNKKAWSQASNDLSQAQITHWASTINEVLDIPLYVKAPLEGAIWFNYPGQTNVWGGNITSSQPSAVARVLDDGSTQSSTFAYDGWGNVTNVVDPIGRTTRFIYSTNGIDLREVRQKVGTGEESLASFSYNSQHLPLVATNANIISKFGYTTNGLLLKATNALGQVTSYGYDSRGYLTNITGHLATDTMGIRYDSAGRVYAVTDSQGYTVTNTYDNLDRLTNSTLPDGTKLEVVYRNLDVAKTKGQDNRWSYFNYDPTQKLTDTQDPSGELVHYEWCGCGELESVTDPKGQMTTWIRDVQSRPLQKIYADLSMDRTVYSTRTSRIKQVIDAANRSATFQYFTDGNIQTASYTNASTGTPGVSFVYDTNYNRVVQKTDTTGTTTFSYVPAGQVAAGSLQSVDGPVPNDTIIYGYDALGRIQSAQIGSAVTTAGYDELGRLKAVTNSLGVFSVAYVGATPRPDVSQRPNGIASAIIYQPVVSNALIQTILFTNATGTVIDRYDYSYTTIGQIQRLTQTQGTNATIWNYTYDLARQLSTATQTKPDGTVHRYSYSYDKAGNRTTTQLDTASATETANNLNQITAMTGGGVVHVAGYLSETGYVAIEGYPARMLSPTNFDGFLGVGVMTNTFNVSATDISGNTTNQGYTLPIQAQTNPTSFGYDASGNLLAKIRTNANLTFEWDGANRCKAVIGTNRTEFAYDGNSHWIGIKEFATTATNSSVISNRRFVWAGDEIIEERDASGSNVVKRFFPQGFQWNGTNYFYLMDHLGSIRTVTDSSGAVVARFDYDPWGKRTQTAGTLTVDLGFTGHFHHQSSGIVLAPGRFYDPETGRWISRDPSGEGAGLNLYAYCGNDPVNNFDVSGYSGIGFCGSAIKTALFSAGIGFAATATLIAVAPTAPVLVVALTLAGGMSAWNYLDKAAAEIRSPCTDKDRADEILGEVLGGFTGGMAGGFGASKASPKIIEHLSRWEKGWTLTPFKYPVPDPPMSEPAVRYEPTSISEVVRMREGKGPRTQAGFGANNIEAHHRQQIPVQNGGIVDEITANQHRMNGNHSRHSQPSQLTPAQRAREIREHYIQRGSEYILPGEGI